MPRTIGATTYLGDPILSWKFMPWLKPGVPSASAGGGTNCGLIPFPGIC